MSDTRLRTEFELCRIERPGAVMHREKLDVIISAKPIDHAIAAHYDLPNAIDPQLRNNSPRAGGNRPTDRSPELRDQRILRPFLPSPEQ